MAHQARILRCHSADNASSQTEACDTHCDGTCLGVHLEVAAVPRLTSVRWPPHCALRNATHTRKHMFRLPPSVQGPLPIRQIRSVCLSAPSDLRLIQVSRCVELPHLRKARAMATRCFSPPLSLRPRSPT